LTGWSDTGRALVHMRRRGRERPRASRARRDDSRPKRRSARPSDKHHCATRASNGRTGPVRRRLLQDFKRPRDRDMLCGRTCVGDAGVDDQLRAHDAGRRADEHDLVTDVARCLHGAFISEWDAAQLPGTAESQLLEAARVAVVADREDVLEPLSVTTVPNLQAHAGRALGQLLRPCACTPRRAGSDRREARDRRLARWSLLAALMQLCRDRSPRYLPRGPLLREPRIEAAGIKPLERSCCSAARSRRVRILVL